MACRVLFMAEIPGFCSGKGREGAESLEESEVTGVSAGVPSDTHLEAACLLSEPGDTQGELPYTDGQETRDFHHSSSKQNQNLEGLSCEKNRLGMISL